MTQNENELIETLRNEVLLGIEAERKRMNDKHDKSIKMVNETPNAQSLLFQLSSIYDNTVSQRNLMKSILKQQLKSEFFKTAELCTKMNYVCFTDGNYSVCFPSYHSQFIVVSRDDELDSYIGTEPALKMSEETLTLIEMWRVSEGTTNEMINLYSKITRGTPSDRLFKLKVKISDEIDKYVLARKAEASQFEKTHKAWLDKAKRREVDKSEFVSFVDGILNDLVSFTEADWKVSFENVSSEFIEALKVPFHGAFK